MRPAISSNNLSLNQNDWREASANHSELGGLECVDFPASIILLQVAFESKGTFAKICPRRGQRKWESSELRQTPNIEICASWLVYVMAITNRLFDPTSSNIV